MQACQEVLWRTTTVSQSTRLQQKWISALSRPASTSPGPSPPAAHPRALKPRLRPLVSVRRSTRSCFCTGRWGAPLYDTAEGLSLPLPLARYPRDTEQRSAGNQCFNCGSTAHGVADCPEPRNQAAMDARRREWQRERGGRPSWSGEPRYFVAPEKSRVAHVVPGRLGEELCCALGIPPDGSAPPPFLAAMLHEGYPPGWVGPEGGERAGAADAGCALLEIHTGGEDMELSDGEERAPGGGAAPAAPATPPRRAVQMVAFPGAFGAPLPAAADQGLWARVAQARAPAGHSAIAPMLPAHPRGDADGYGRGCMLGPGGGWGGMFDLRGGLLRQAAHHQHPGGDQPRGSPYGGDQHRGSSYGGGHVAGVGVGRSWDYCGGPYGQAGYYGSGPGPPQVGLSPGDPGRGGLDGAAGAPDFTGAVGGWDWRDQRGVPAAGLKRPLPVGPAPSSGERLWLGQAPPDWSKRARTGTHMYGP